MLSGVRNARRRVAVVVLVVATAVVGAVGCSPGDDPASTGADGPGASAEASGVDYLEDPSEVPKLLRDRFGEVPSLRRLNLSADSIRAQVRDPEIPDNLDDWVYRDGEWTSTPVSVSVNEIAEFDDVTFVPGAIAWDKIPELVQATYDGVELEEEEITSVSFDRIAGDPVRVYIGVSGLRGNGRLLGLADGTEYDVERS